MTDPSTVPSDPAPAPPRMSGALPMPAEQDPSGFFKFVGILAIVGVFALDAIVLRAHDASKWLMLLNVPPFVLVAIIWRPDWMNRLLMFLADKAPSWITAYRKPGA